MTSRPENNPTNGHDPDVPPRFSTAEDVNPPVPGDPGYEDYVARREAWRQSIADDTAGLLEPELTPSPYFDGRSGQMVTLDGGAQRPSHDGSEPDAAVLIELGPAPDNVEDGEGQLRRRTDTANGEFFARLHGDQVRFDHRRRRWLLWRQHWWAEGDTETVRRLAKEAARQRYQDALGIADLGERSQESRFAIRSENKYRLDARLAQARSELPIADAGDDAADALIRPLLTVST